MATPLEPIDDRFKHGLELFNQKEYFECHEVIEELWLETPPSDTNRDLYKGVIQAAAAVYQFRRKILTGALGLYQTAVFNLEKYRPGALGLNVDKLIDEMRKCFACFDDWDKKTPLVMDGRLEPKVEYDFSGEINEHS